MVVSHFPQDLNPFQVYAHEATITALRAEVESLRGQRSVAYQQGVDDGTECMQREVIKKAREVESLQAQLAHQQILFVLAERVVTNAESDLAAVRTDLSVARTRISDLEIEIACLTVTPVASSAPASPISPQGGPVKKIPDHFEEHYPGYLDEVVALALSDEEIVSGLHMPGDPCTSCGAARLREWWANEDDA